MEQGSKFVGRGLRSALPPSGWKQGGTGGRKSGVRGEQGVQEVVELWSGRWLGVELHMADGAVGGEGEGVSDLGRAQMRGQSPEGWG